jgi:predicted Fe-S protein YdhL (DUF1289 family)
MNEAEVNKWAVLTKEERLEIITLLTMTTRYSETFLHTLSDEQLKREMERYE